MVAVQVQVAYPAPLGTQDQRRHRGLLLRQGASVSEPEKTTCDEYEKWLDRLRSTYESVGFACLPRLHDRRLADQVSAQVVAGLIARPSVFQYFGLPFSARVGHLAEHRIAAARAGTLRPTASWPELLGALRALPELERRVFVLACVRGMTVPAIADALALPEAGAAELQDQVINRMQTIAGEDASPEGLAEGR